jgi:hypothetical protein
MKFPIPEQSTTADSPTGPVLVRPYQVVVPIGLWAGDQLSPRFPAILDTGHSHNLSIRREQFREWVKADLKQTGFIRVNNQVVPLAQADLDLEGTRIRCPEGIAVYPDSHPSAPRLPLLGLRAIVRNGLTVIIDGLRRQVTIS